MWDTVLAYVIVGLAFAYAIWRLAFPVRWKVWLRHTIRGEAVPCNPEPQTGQCGGGCSGCALAQRPNGRQESKN